MGGGTTDDTQLPRTLTLHGQGRPAQSSTVQRHTVRRHTVQRAVASDVASRDGMKLPL